MRAAEHVAGDAHTHANQLAHMGHAAVVGRWGYGAHVPAIHAYSWGRALQGMEERQIRGEMGQTV